MARLIESDFPFPELSLIAERESWRKEVYRPLYYLHKWWARRLGAVFRGILLGACLQESEDFWQRYYSKNCFADTVVFDPFMGSGVTLGEAIKLGCRAAGRDVNPVAWLSVRAALSSYSFEEVLSEYRRLERDVAPRLRRRFETTTSAGDIATVLYYFLVKVVPCPKCDGQIDLFRTRVFSQNAVPKKDPSARSVCPECGAINPILFNAQSVKCPDCATAYNPQVGNIEGPRARCNHCGVDFRLVDRMRDLSGPLSFRRYAKLLLTPNGEKKYEALNDGDRELEREVAAEYAKIVDSFPNVRIAPGHNTNQVLKHNYRYWHELFSDRQLVCAKDLMEAIRGTEPEGLKLLFACLFSGVLEFNNLFTSFKGEGTGAVRHMFAHHVLKPEVMPLEANMWGTTKSSGAFSSLFDSRVKRALGYKSDPFELRLNGKKSRKVRGINRKVEMRIARDFREFAGRPDTAYVSVGDSSCVDLPDDCVDLVVTDPPFFDNVHYSELADFFYYWLNQIIEVSADTTTRSPKEVQDTDVALFASKLTGVFAECRRVLRIDGLFVFTYHHSRYEGWTAVHRAIRDAGFACVQSYPIKAEMSVSMPLQQAKSPIHLDLILVCKAGPKKDQGPDSEVDIPKALCEAKDQVASLRSVGIRVSLGDAKVVVMGRLLCEAHAIGNLEEEERFLAEVEREIDSYVSDVIGAQGDILYKEKPREAVQLTLFEGMEDYLANKRTRPAAGGRH